MINFLTHTTTTTTAAKIILFLHFLLVFGSLVSWLEKDRNQTRPRPVTRSDQDHKKTVNILAGLDQYFVALKYLLYFTQEHTIWSNNEKDMN